jgi:hypothetical protein
MRAFLSYQTRDKHVAAEVREVLEDLDITSFVAHDDIKVSREWQAVILEEIAAADVFVPILSKNYRQSPFCMQESGIAVFRIPELTIVPLSIDRSVSPGFMSFIQSRRVSPGHIRRDTDAIVDSIGKFDSQFITKALIKWLRRSFSYRNAEYNFELLRPYLPKASKKQCVAILEAAIANSEIAYSPICATKYLPPLMQDYGKYLRKEDRASLKEIITRARQGRV